MQEAKLKDMLEKVVHHKMIVQKQREDINLEQLPIDEDIMNQNPCSRCYSLLFNQVKVIREQYDKLFEFQDQVQAEKDQLDKERMKLELDKVSIGYITKYSLP